MGLLRFVYFIPVVAKQKMPALAQENQTPSNSKAWARWSWYPKTHLPPLSRMLPAPLSGQGTRRISRPRQTCTFSSWWVSFLLIFCPPPARAKPMGLSHQRRCASYPEMLFTARKIINIWRGSLISCHLSLVMKLQRMQVSDVARQYLPIPVLWCLSAQTCVQEPGFALENRWL